MIIKRNINVRNSNIRIYVYLYNVYTMKYGVSVQILEYKNKTSSRVNRDMMKTLFLHKN